AAGLDTQPATNDLYAADRNNDKVVVFAPTPLPEVTTGPATEVKADSGTITGRVDPAGPGTVNQCQFEILEGPVRHEGQSLKLSSNTKEGKFTLTFQGQTTKPILYETSFSAASTIEYYLTQLSTIGAHGVHVTQASSGPFLIEFTGQFSDLNVSPIT